MKKTNLRKLAAFTASILAVAALAVPMTSAFTADAASITIGNTASTVHTYDVYQIFTGTLADGKLGDLVWGESVTKYKNEEVAAGTSVPDEVVDALTELNNKTGTEKDNAVADWVAENLTLGSTVAQAKDNEKCTVEDDGYYLLKDVTAVAGEDDARSIWILQVVGDTTPTVKSAKPDVEKLVWDEVADMDDTATNPATSTEKAAGWGKSADHSIGESFQFKLKATIPDNPDLQDYETYKLVFNDTLMEGVTFESIESLTINGGSDLWESHGTDISTTATNGVTNTEFTFTIDDVKKYVSSGWGTSEILVEVVYNAHLNENADIADATGDTTTKNVNKVYLEYSNNPNYHASGDTNNDGTDDNTGEKESLGETPEKVVDVYTYLVNGKKVAGDENGAATTTALEGVKFKLYDAQTEGNEIKVVQVNGSTYRLAIGNETGVDIVTGTDGKFVIQGLDHGTYWLEETETLPGYNKLASRQQVTLTADHTFDQVTSLAYTGAAGAVDSSNTYVIVNNQGSTLPSTGGMGTTLFYVGGGALALGAGVLLVSKKRMANK